MEPYGEGVLRSREEIEHALETIDSEPGRLDWKGDNFRYGYLIGKLLALEWVLDEPLGADVAQHFEFDGWMKELKDLGDDISERLSGPEVGPPS